MGPSGNDAAAEGDLRHGVHVHGVAQGLSDALVAQGLIGAVEAAVLEGVAHEGDDIDGLAVAESLHLGGGQADGDVYLAGFEGHAAGGVVSNGADDEVLELRQLAPVLLVALKHDSVAGDPLDELVGAGADGVAAVDVVAACGLDGALADDEGGVVGQVGQEGREDVLRAELNGVFVYYFGLGGVEWLEYHGLHDTFGRRGRR